LRKGVDSEGAENGEKRGLRELLLADCLRRRDFKKAGEFNNNVKTV
jgi:hypothetical protein